MSSLAANASPMRRTAACRRLRSRTASLKAVLGLLDALASIGGHQQQQPGQRQHEQDREDVAVSRLGGKEADRRQTGVDGPNQPEDVQLQRRRDAPRRALAQAWRTRRRRRNSPRTPPRAAGSSARPGSEAPATSSTQRRPYGVPGVGNREQRGARTSRAREPSPTSRASKRPAATRHGTAPAGPARASGSSTRCVGSTLPAPDRELDPGEDHVEADEDARHGRIESARGAGEQQQSAGRREEQQREHDLGDELAARQAPRPAVPGVLEEAVGRRLAAHVVDRAHGLVIGREAQYVVTAVARAGARATGIMSVLAVGIDVDVVDRPAIRRSPRGRRRAGPTSTDCRSTCHSTVLNAIGAVGRQTVSPALTEPTTVSLTTPLGLFARSLMFRTPHEPLVRRAYRRNDGCSMPAQNHGDTALPVALIASDLVSLVRYDFADWFPFTTEAPLSDQPWRSRSRRRPRAPGCSRHCRRTRRTPWLSAWPRTRPGRRHDGERQSGRAQAPRRVCRVLVSVEIHRARQRPPCQTCRTAGRVCQTPPGGGRLLSSVTPTVVGSQAPPRTRLDTCSSMPPS